MRRHGWRKGMEVSLSKAAMWAAVAVVLALLLMVVGEWPLALTVALIGGAGYVVAKSFEDARARSEQAQPGN